MGRRTRRRYVKRTPENFYFADRTHPEENIVQLTIAEFEAMRLKHYIQLNQQESAEKMEISQPTFSRILENAHKKVTIAIVEGKNIQIIGGNVTFKEGFIGYGCLNCDNEWEDKNASKDTTVECPNCASNQVYYLEREPI